MLGLPGAWAKDVEFGEQAVLVSVALRRKRPVCDRLEHVKWARAGARNTRDLSPPPRGLRYDFGVGGHGGLRAFDGLRRRAPAATLATALALLAGCGGGHRTAANKSKPVASRGMTFKLLAAVQPLKVTVPSQPIGTTPTTIPGLNLRLYVVR